MPALPAPLAWAEVRPRRVLSGEGNGGVRAGDLLEQGFQPPAAGLQIRG